MGGDGTHEEKERVRGVYEKEAPKYDRGMRFFERFILGAGGRPRVEELVRSRLGIVECLAAGKDAARSALGQQ